MCENKQLGTFKNIVNTKTLSDFLLETSFPIKTLQNLLNDFNRLVLASPFPSSFGWFSTLHLHSPPQKTWVTAASPMTVLKRKRLALLVMRELKKPRASKSGSLCGSGVGLVEGGIPGALPLGTGCDCCRELAISVITAGRD